MELNKSNDVVARLFEAEEVAEFFHFELSLNAGKVGVWKWDYDTGKFFWSRQQESLYGLSEGEFDGTYEMWAGFVIDKETLNIRETEAKAYGEKEIELEFRIRRKDSEIIWILSRIKNVFEDNEPRYAVGVNIDITQRKVVEQQIAALYEQERNLLKELEFEKKKYQEAFLNSPAAVSLYEGPSHLITFANNNFITLTANAKNLIEGLPASQVLPVSAARYLTDLNFAFQNGSVVRRDQESILFSAGSNSLAGFYRYILTPLKNVNEMIYGVMSIILDVTSEVNAKKIILQNEERLAMAVEMNQVGFWDVCPGTDQITWSDQCLKVLGCQPGVKPSLEMFLNSVLPEDRQGVIDGIQAATDPTRMVPFDMEFRFIGIHDKKFRWIHARGKLFTDASGNFNRFFGVNQDITDKKVYTVSLENLVEERTARLNRAVEELQSSNASLEQFARIASHDLKEPLRKIEMYATFLQQKNENFSTLQLKFLHKIVSTSERLSFLIKDILTLSKVTDPDAEFKPTDLNVVAADVIDDLEIMIAVNNAVIKYDHLPTLNAISSQIYQLLFNILENAIKFSKPGTRPEIHIDVQDLSVEEKQRLMLAPSQDYVIIVIEDNGIGFEEQILKKVFDVFDRTAQAGRPTGIGLAICKKIVESHKGEIYALSKRGEGSQVFIILPGQVKAS